MTHPQMDWQIHKTDLSSRIKELYNHNQWTDCAFRVGDDHTEIVRGHKVVLAVSSPVFEALFFGSLAEKKEIIEVPDLEPHTFHLLLKYIYCDSTELDSIDDAGHLLYAAKKYMMPHLARACLDFLLEHTHINTLWEVLAFAEDLHEDELLTSCLMVMCQYPGEMWINSNEHIGLVTLSKLLDQSTTNLMEVELWQLVTAWAADQCVLRNLCPTANNKRALINQAGILCKVRFLTLSAMELAEIVEPSGLLSVEEVDALHRSISALNSKKLILSNNSLILPENITVPVGFSATRETRKRFTRNPSRCLRHCLTKRKKYTYGGIIKSKVNADSKILVTGFEVFTRIASTADFMMGHGFVNHYCEDLVITVCDDEENLINKTDVRRLVAAFNVTQEISLSEPVWFYPDHEYTVSFELSSGQYPLSDLSPVAFAKAVRFRFNKCEQIVDENSVEELDVSFINGVVFNV